MRHAALVLDITDEELKNTLRATIGYAMQVFTDLLVQIEEMDAEPSIDTYTWETMSESLVSASLFPMPTVPNVQPETGFCLLCSSSRAGRETLLPSPTPSER